MFETCTKVVGWLCQFVGGMVLIAFSVAVVLDFIVALGAGTEVEDEQA